MTGCKSKWPIGLKRPRATCELLNSNQPVSGRRIRARIFHRPERDGSTAVKNHLEDDTATGSFFTVIFSGTARGRVRWGRR